MYNVVRKSHFVILSKVCPSLTASLSHCGIRDQPRDQVVLPLCLLTRQVHFSSPAARAALEKVTVMEEAVEHCGDGDAVTEELSPVLSTGRLKISSALARSSLSRWSA